MPRDFLLDLINYPNWVINRLSIKFNLDAISAIKSSYLNTESGYTVCVGDSPLKIEESIKP